jgi:hypothetical protein
MCLHQDVSTIKGQQLSTKPQDLQGVPPVYVTSQGLKRQKNKCHHQGHRIALRSVISNYITGVYFNHSKEPKCEHFLSKRTKLRNKGRNEIYCIAFNHDD